MHTLSDQSQLPGQVAIKVTLYATGERGSAAFDVNVDAKRVQMAIEGEHAPHLAFFGHFSCLGAQCRFAGVNRQ